MRWIGVMCGKVRWGHHRLTRRTHHTEQRTTSKEQRLTNTEQKGKEQRANNKRQTSSSKEQRKRTFTTNGRFTLILGVRGVPNLKDRAFTMNGNRKTKVQSHEYYDRSSHLPKK